MTPVSDGDGFPDGFFARADETPDTEFYDPVRLVTHIDDGAIAAVGALYEELGIDGDVLDLMSSWVSHFESRPRNLTVLGMNASELDHNPMAEARVVHDLNADPKLPFADATFDAAVCCVSVDYLVRPVDVFRDVGRVLRAGGVFVCTFSNRLFPTKAIRGWLATDDAGHCAIVERYFERSRMLRARDRTALHSARRPRRSAPTAVWATCHHRAAARDHRDRDRLRRLRRPRAPRAAARSRAPARARRHPHLPLRRLRRPLGPRRRRSRPPRRLTLSPAHHAPLLPWYCVLRIRHRCSTGDRAAVWRNNGAGELLC